MISPDLPPAESLAATRFTIGDFDVSLSLYSSTVNNS